jgi:hypothetical protein
MKIKLTATGSPREVARQIIDGSRKRLGLYPKWRLVLRPSFAIGCFLPGFVGSEILPECRDLRRQARHGNSRFVYDLMTELRKLGPESFVC